MATRKLIIKRINPDRLVIELVGVSIKDDTVDLLREARDKLIEQVGASEKGQVSLGKILSQKVS